MTKEFPNYSSHRINFVQENAWMDEGAIIEWVEKILKPYFALALENIISILVLNFYH